MSHLVASTNNNATYVIQVYSAFSPPHLTPLLVRLSEAATVKEAIHAALTKLLEQDPTVVVPSDYVAEYTMRCAGGEGQPLFQSLAFEHDQVLREAAGLEFPFMIHLGYTAGGRNATMMDGTQNMSGGGVGGSDYSMNRLGGAMSSGKHVPLSAIEKAAMEAHKREIEARRAENVKQIERRRFESQLNAFHHSENYELARKEEAAKKAALALKQEQERALRDQEMAMGIARDEESRRAQLEAVKKGNERVVEQMRAEMQSAIAGDAKRRAELAEALEIRRREQAHASEMEREKKRLLLEAQRHHRTTTDFDNLLADLDKACEYEAVEVERCSSADRQRRQIFQRADADSHAIALIEQQRNYTKLNARQDRLNKDALDDQRMQMLLQQQQAAQEEEDARQQEVMVGWRTKQDASMQHITSAYEREMLQQQLGNTNASNVSANPDYIGNSVMTAL